MPHSRQKLSCLRRSVDHPQFIDDEAAEELLTPLLRQFNFLCECGIRLPLNITIKISFICDLRKNSNLVNILKIHKCINVPA